MKYAVVFFLLAIFIVCETNAALFFEIDTKSTTHPNKCYSKVYKLHLKFNKNYRMPDTCGRMTCDKTYQITYATCGTVGVEGNYKLVEDKSLPYPQCCPKPVLIEEEE